MTNARPPSCTAIIQSSTWEGGGTERWRDRERGKEKGKEKGRGQGKDGTDYTDPCVPLLSRATPHAPSRLSSFTLREHDLARHACIHQAARSSLHAPLSSCQSPLFFSPASPQSAQWPADPKGASTEADPRLRDTGEGTALRP